MTDAVRAGTRHPTGSRRAVLLWLVAIVVTLASVVYQRVTGPTYPVRGVVTVGDTTVRFRLPTSHASDGDAALAFEVADPSVDGVLEWRRYRSFDAWRQVPFERRDGRLVAAVPRQPPAGKVLYRIVLAGARGDTVALTASPVVIRFKGAVPAAVLIPHVILMFAAMLLATRTGLEAAVRGPRAQRLAVVTAVLLAVGGLVLGPIVQKYAFDAYWTGWPLGHDVTDMKTAVAMLVWLVALWCGRGGRPARGWLIAAAVTTLAVYLVPHSVLGSELDHTRGAPPG
jgi:hypothetical protein